MSAFVFAPEFLRNARIQLRLGRVFSTLVICAVISLAAVAYFSHSSTSGSSGLFVFVIFVQIVALVIGGGVYCLQSIHREKDLNTFDYQRITRLTPLELALGKLLGAPALTFLISLSFMPVGLWAAFGADIRFSVLFEIYSLLFLGALAYNLLALLISLFVGRGTSAGSILFFLAVIGATSADYSEGASRFAVHKLSPFFVTDLLSQRSVIEGFIPPLKDFFFGMTVPHVVTLTILYLTLAGWFLLAIVRNIKKDPSIYEAFSPVQAFAFVVYLNFLMLGFFRWVIPTFTVRNRAPTVTYRTVLPGEAESTLLALSLWFFVILGFSLFRNRERVRRRISRLGSRAAGWGAAIWPAPYLLAGALLVGLAIVTMIHLKLGSDVGWSTGMGTLEVLFFAAWLVRDGAYLQWMNLRPKRRPLVTAVLYLIVFYACVGTVLAAFKLYGAESARYAVALIPSFAFQIDLESWLGHREAWIGALAFLVAQTILFAWLQRRELQTLLSTTPIAPITGDVTK